MWERTETVRRISNLVTWLPRGARLWQMMGGPAAVTRETEATIALETTQLGIAWVQGGKKGKQPEGRSFPASVEEERQAAAYTETRAAAWRRKHADKLKR